MDQIPNDHQIQEARAMLVSLPAVHEGWPEPGNVMALATALARRDDEARRGLGGNAPPAPIDPENLLRTPPETIPDLLTGSYPLLVRRGADLVESAQQWQADRGRATIADQQQADDLVEQMQQISLFAHTKTGEVEAARRRVKEPIYEAGKAVDGFFAGLRNRLLEIAGLDPYGSGPTTIQGQLSAWQRAKVERERADRAAAARRLQEEADAKLAAARATGDDDAIVEATVAEETAIQAARAATAPAAALASHTTARGVSVGLRANWTFRVIDIEPLILMAALPAVMERLSGVQEITVAGLLPKIRAALTVPGGPVPLDFLTTNDSTIRHSIKGERGRRECAGLEIFNDAQASRRG